MSVTLVSCCLFYFKGVIQTMVHN